MTAKHSRSSKTEEKPLEDRHLWEIRPLRDLAILLVVVVLFWAVYSIRSVTAPIVIGFGLAYVFNPFVSWAWRWKKVPRWASTSAVMLAGLLAAVGVVLYAVPKLVSQAGDLIGDLTAFIRTNTTLRSLWSNFTDKVAESSQELDAESLKPILDELSGLNFPAIARFLLKSLDIGVGAVGSLFSTTTYLVLVAVIVGFCFFFFSWKFQSITGWFKSLIPGSQQERALEVIGMMDRSVAAFVRGRLVQAVVMGTILSIGWLIAGVPYWLLLGMGCGLLNLVPYAAVVGCLAAVAMSCVHALAGPEAAFTWGAVIWPTAVYVAAQLIDGWVVEPLVQGKATDLDPLTVLLVVLIGGALAGLLGMLLAIPAAACVKILAREVILPKWHAYADSRT